MDIKEVREMLKDAPVIKPQDDEEVNAKETIEDKAKENAFIDKRFMETV